MKSRILFLCLLSIFMFTFTGFSQNEPSVEVFPLTESLYKLVCRANGAVNVVTSVGNDGVLLIDDGYQQTQALLAAEVKKLSPARVKFLINTHYHFDHTATNEFWANEGATIISHQNVRQHLTSGQSLLNEISEKAQPHLVFKDEVKLYFNGDTLRVFHFPWGHTGGDAIVHFTRTNIMVMGDILFAEQFPYIDFGTGGHLKSYIQNFEKLLQTVPSNTKFIAGHGRDYTFADMQEYLTMLKTTSQLVENGIAQGKTAIELKQADVLKDWDDWSQGFISKDYWIDTIFLSNKIAPGHPLTSIIDPLFRVLSHSDGVAAAKKYRELKQNSADAYDFSEAQINGLGYYLLGKERARDAVEIFKINVEDYPQSWNVYDSLGEAYMTLGDNQQAIQLYRKSLELNPDNENGQSMLKKLEGK